jgi:hypothetical protein
MQQAGRFNGNVYVSVVSNEISPQILSGAAIQHHADAEAKNSQI